MTRRILAIALAAAAVFAAVLGAASTAQSPVSYTHLTLPTTPYV